MPVDDDDSLETVADEALTNIEAKLDEVVVGHMHRARLNHGVDIEAIGNGWRDEDLVRGLMPSTRAASSRMPGMEGGLFWRREGDL